MASISFTSSSMTTSTSTSSSSSTDSTNSIKKFSVEELNMITSLFHEALESSKWEAELNKFNKHFSEISNQFTIPMQLPNLEGFGRINPLGVVDVNIKMQEISKQIHAIASTPPFDKTKDAISLADLKIGFMSGNFYFSIIECRLQELNRVLDSCNPAQKQQAFLKIASYFADNITENNVFNLNDLTPSLKRD